MNDLATIKEIYFYPIKSLAGIKLEKCLVTKLGIAHPEITQVIDRKWMVIDENGNFITQRKIPKMVLIKPIITTDYIILTANGQIDCKVPIQPTNSLIKCRVWNSKVDAYRYGGEISKWISEFLGEDKLDLVNLANDLEPRYVKKQDQNNNCTEYDQIIFHDLSAFTFISQASLNDLNSKLISNNHVKIQNFRPNFYVSGCDAFAEDNWTKFSIGKSQFSKIKQCTRCLLTTINPDTGIKCKDHEPFKTLKTYRCLDIKLYGYLPMFGINVSLVNNNDNTDYFISVGDKILE